MKVTKYPQSCLLLEKDGKRIVIDPGSFFAAKYGIGDLGQVEAVLYTHQHADHFDPEISKQFQAQGVVLYGNYSVVALIGAGATQIEHGQEFELAGFKVRAHSLPHCLLPDGSEGPPNTGYIIDEFFFHPGDGIETAEKVIIETLALPIAGPSISFYHAAKFADSLGTKKVIPMHYDNIDLFLGNPHGFAKVYDKAEVIVLADGESAEI